MSEPGFEDTRTGVGSTVDEKYQIIDLLGRGGMADVWLARDQRLGKLWAIKEIRANHEGAHAARVRQSLIDEADFMKRLDHPAIPRIVDILDTGKSIFVVMDYVEGCSLASLLRMRAGTPFDQQDVLNWGVQLCDVLGYLHRHDPPILYRDLKPANVIARDDGSVKLIDFGISLELDDGADSCEAAGTPGYAAPEQLGADASPKTLDTRADVYSLGATLYTLASGHTPQRAPQGLGVDFEMRPLREWNAQLSEGLERIVLRATQPDPALRYQTIDEMRYDLEHYEELEDAWRNERLARLKRFRRVRCLASVACLVGVLLVMAGGVLREESYADLIHEAASASLVAREGHVSEAESLYTQAIQLEPTRIEPYERLLDVYEADWRLTEDEAARWQRLCGSVRGLEANPRYARLCLRVGISYMSYYRVDKGGGSVGNAGIASMANASPWFERVVALTSNEGAAQVDDSDIRAAKTYLVIARFYGEVMRAGREGVAAGELYRQFWDSLSQLLTQESDRSVMGSTEGVKARLCQVASEVLASPTYLAGFARAGIERVRVEEMTAMVREVRAQLDGFARTEEYAVVYGPVFAQIDEQMALADLNVGNVYANPVTRWEEQV